MLNNTLIRHKLLCYGVLILRNRLVKAARRQGNETLGAYISM